METKMLSTVEKSMSTSLSSSTCIATAVSIILFAVVTTTTTIPTNSSSLFYFCVCLCVCLVLNVDSTVDIGISIGNGREQRAHEHSGTCCARPTQPPAGEGPPLGVPPEAKQIGEISLHFPSQLPSNGPHKRAVYSEYSASSLFQ